MMTMMMMMVMMMVIRPTLLTKVELALNLDQTNDYNNNDDENNNDDDDYLSNTSYKS